MFEIFCIMQEIKPYNLLTNKRLLKYNLNNLQTTRKKLKKYWKARIELSIYDIIKVLNMSIASVSRYVKIKLHNLLAHLMRFIDQQK